MHRSSLLAWQADFSDQSYRHLRDIYPDLYDAVIAPRPTPTNPNTTTGTGRSSRRGGAGFSTSLATATKHPIKSILHNNCVHHQGCSSKRSADTGPGDQAAAPSAAVPPRTSTESPSRPSSYPPATASRRKRTPPARRQPSLAPAQKASTRRPRSRTFLRAAARSAAGSRTRSSSSSSPLARASLSSRPLILAPANCAYPRVDSTEIWILQHRYEGAPRPTRRAPHPPPSDDPYDLPDLYWHRPPRAESSSNPPRGHGRAEHYNLSASPPPERSARAVYSGLAAFNPDRV